MKKFKFQLAALLKVTKMKKEQAEIEFAESSQRLLKEQRVLKKIEEEEQENIRAYYKIAQNSVKINDLVFYSSYFEHVKKRKSQQALAIVEAETYNQQCLQVLRKAMSKLKTIEQLREKRLDQFKQSMLDEEQKELDEIGLKIYTRMVR